MKSADKKQTQMNGQDRMKVRRALTPEKMKGLASPEFPCRTLMIRTSSMKMRLICPSLQKNERLIS